MYLLQTASVFLLLISQFPLLAQIDSMEVENPSADQAFTSLTFVGSGDLQQALIGGSGFSANTGLGLILLRNWGKEFPLHMLELDLNVNIASSSDTMGWNIARPIRENQYPLGSFLLNPRSAGQSANFNMDAYFGEAIRKKTAKLISGLHCQLNTSNNLLRVGKEKLRFSGLAFDVGIFHEFVPMDIRVERGYSITLGISYAYRGLLGELSAPGSEVFRDNFLQIPRSHFHGLNFTFGFRLQNVRAMVQIPLFPAGDHELPGLTSSQLLTGIGFVGGFPISIDGVTRVRGNR
jgi:hypothetical protein